MSKSLKLFHLLVLKFIRTRNTYEMNFAWVFVGFCSWLTTSECKKIDLRHARSALAFTVWIFDSFLGFPREKRTSLFLNPCQRRRFCNGKRETSGVRKTADLAQVRSVRNCGWFVICLIPASSCLVDAGALDVLVRKGNPLWLNKSSFPLCILDLHIIHRAVLPFFLPSPSCSVLPSTTIQTYQLLGLVNCDYSSRHLYPHFIH